jgi:hypothetical protein
LLLRKHELPVDEHVVLALRAFDHLGRMPDPVDLGGETRSPFVVAASDGAVEDAHVRHVRNLPFRADLAEELPCSFASTRGFGQEDFDRATATWVRLI